MIDRLRSVLPTGRKQADTRGAAGRTTSANRTCAAPSNRWWILPASLLAAIVLFGWTYYPVARVQYRETREVARLQAELNALQARNARLSKEVERLKTPEGVEDYARTRLGLVKAGEHVVVVVDESQSVPPTQLAMAMAARPTIDSDETTAGPVGPWTGFLDFVFGVE